jgi:hypothetical protein
MSQLLTAEMCVAWYRGDVSRVLALQTEGSRWVRFFGGAISQRSNRSAADLAWHVSGDGSGHASLGSIYTLPLALLEGGEFDAAREELRREFAAGLHEASPLGPVGNLCAYGEVAAGTGSLDIAASIYEALLPYAGRSAVDGISCLGTVDHALAVLADALGRPEEAEQRFAAAEVGNRAFGPFQAGRTFLAWGQVLLARDNNNDRHRAVDLLTRARDLAARYGCAGIEDAAATLLASATTTD